MSQWYQFHAQAKGAAEIVIYDEIGAFGVPAKDRAAAWNGVGSSPDSISILER
jgi:hypothetical protein